MAFWKFKEDVSCGALVDRLAERAEVPQSSLLRRSLSKLWTILIVVVTLWLLGFLGGNLLLLVIALIVLIANLIQGRRVV
jgi:ABC-type bacteriocin/lantibiotic exporter with double-glycine peptidase domain